MATEAVENRRFTVDEYYRMADAGILGPDDRVELIEGMVVQMPPIGTGHSSTLKRLTAALRAALGAGSADFGVQAPLRLSDISQPEPDLVLARFRADYYAEHHPTPEDVLLLVEVSLTTLAFDRGTKQRAYAGAGIAEYWLVDLEQRRVEVYRQPAAGGYRSHQVFDRQGVLSPLAFPEVQIEVADILP